jgi:hypothetical protein
MTKHVAAPGEQNVRRHRKCAISYSRLSLCGSLLSIHIDEHGTFVQFYPRLTGMPEHDPICAKGTFYDDLLLKIAAVLQNKGCD